MSLDYELIEDICLFRYNRHIDVPVRVNLRDATISQGYIMATCAVGDPGIPGERVTTMQEFSIGLEEYNRLLREKKLKSIGI